jgi:predicted RNase H-like HicB family nuclease
MPLEMMRAKHGWLARAPELHLAAYGKTPELARANLERLLALFHQALDRPMST